jgi:hypothetical protein
MKYLDNWQFKPRERDYMTTRPIDEQYGTKKHRKVSELIRDKHFWSVWKHGNEDDLFEVVTKIHALLNVWICEQEGVEFILWRRGEGEPWRAHTDKIVQPMDREEFDEALHYTRPFHPSYLHARHEFWRLIMRDF